MLDHLGVAHEIQVTQALSMLSREDDDLGSRPVEWFISLVSAALQKNLYNELWTLRCVVTSQGERIVPPTADEEGEILCRSIRGALLAFELGLAHVIHEKYLAATDQAKRVRDWLEESQILRDSPNGEQLSLQSLLRQIEIAFFNCRTYISEPSEMNSVSSRNLPSDR